MQMLPAIALLIDIISEVVLSVFNAIKQHAVQIQKMPHSICEAALARSGTTEKHRQTHSHDLGRKNEWAARFPRKAECMVVYVF